MKGRYSNRSELRDRRQEKEDRAYAIIRNLLTAAIVLCVMAIIAAMMASCTTTRVITVETLKHDTTYISKIERDSVWMHDSIHIKEKGNSVIIERWHTKWRERLLIDTVYKSKVDTIPAPYEVIKEVEKQLSWWQKTQMIAGDVMLIALILVVGWQIVKRKFMR